MDIHTKIKRGELPQGYELQTTDVGAQLSIGEGFGHVMPIDVGKKVYAKSYGFAMENNEQRNKRKGI